MTDTTEAPRHGEQTAATVENRPLPASAAGRSFSVLQVVINPFPEVRGGVDTMVTTLVEHLGRQGCTSTVFVPGSWEDSKLRHYRAGSTDVYMRRLRTPTEPRRPLRNLVGLLGEAPRIIADLRMICRRHGIDLVHVHTATDYAFYFRILSAVTGIPYLITFHRGDVVDFKDRNAAQKILIRWSIAGARATSAVSPWLADLARQVFASLCSPAAINNGIAGTAKPGAPGPLPGRFFLMVGSFDHYKGHDIALRAWRLVSRRYPDLRLLVAGDGALRGDYERLIRENGCSGSIDLLGQLSRNEVLRLMRSSIALVFPSRTEGLGYVMLEAGLMETPVVCSDIPPLNEVVIDGATGLVVEPENSDDLARALLLLLDDPDLRNRLGRGMAKRVATDYSAEGMADAYLSLYGGMLGSGP
ncbi:MAG TPA: glycosyltransferase family 4 protein [Arenibaculum sp.]|nr:glycosyltransferase family 4 protein [Arenibaculum sp.]